MKTLAEGDWHLEFVDFFNSYSKFFDFYLREHPNEESIFLRFLIDYMESCEEAIDIVMEQLPIIPILIDYLNSNDLHLFKIALKTAGTILSGPSNEYCEAFYKNDILQALVIGLRRFESSDSGPDIRKEIVWIIGNMLTSQSSIITKSVVGNAFLIEKMKEILGATPPTGSQESIKVDLTTRKETLHVLYNLVVGYGIEIHYDLIYRYNIFEVLLPYLADGPSAQNYLFLPFLVLEILNNVFMKEQLVGSNEFYILCEKMGGIDLIEQMQLHP